MPITQTTDHVVQALAVLLQQYKEKPNLAGLLTAFVSRVQEAENALFGVLSMPELGPVNLVRNPSFEADSNGDGLADLWSVYNNSPGPEPATPSLVDGLDSTFGQRVAWSVNNTSTKGIVQTASPAWLAAQAYVVAVKSRASGTNIGKFIGMAWNTPPPNPANTIVLACPPLTGAYQQYAFKIAWDVGAAPKPEIHLTISNVATGSAAVAPTQGTLDFDEVMAVPGTTIPDFQTTGANLDLLGRVLGEPRNGRTDLSYRTALQARILLNRSSGTIEQIYELLALLLAVNNIATSSMQLKEFYPKGFILRLGGVAVPDVIAADLASILKKAKDAGATGQLEYGNTSPPFGFDGNGAGFETGFFGGTL